MTGDKSVLDVEFLKEENRRLRDTLDQRGDKLKAANDRHTKLQSEFEKFRSDQEQIFKYLSQENESKDEEIANLQAEVKKLETAKDSLKEEFEQRLDEEKGQYSDFTDKLSKKITKYETELLDLHEFIDKKNDLEKELKHTKDELEKERRDHRNIVAELERKAVQEQDRLQKLMLQKIKETKSQFMKLTDSQLETTTKRTIIENEKMSTELAYQSRETEKLILVNEKVSTENRALKREIELFKQTEKELAKRNHSYLRTIRTLLTKLKAAGAERPEADIPEIDEDPNSEVLELYRTKVTTLESTLKATEEELVAAEQQRDEASKELKMVLDLHDEVSRFVLICLHDAKQQLQAISREQTSEEGELSELPSRLDSLSLPQRERVLKYLFAKLGAFKALQKQNEENDKMEQSASRLPPINGGSRPSSSTANRESPEPQASITTEASGTKVSGMERKGKEEERGRIERAKKPPNLSFFLFFLSLYVCICSDYSACRRR
uniref:Cilia- and flagella-associated protein 157 n=1 Tax=Palpitomonas bilix TaxID=652834 RepID=A0A7S3G3T4_9EUKA|mmetsp:Transcript_23890/g.60423  ORF Transcript_23890/g.60423 Transcript_23890/m.60423 type:complete len:495 (+) Transcript_23890:252-1736(+)